MSVYGAYYFAQRDVTDCAFEYLEGFPLLWAWIIDLSPLIISLASVIKGMNDFLEDQAEATHTYHMWNG